MDGRLRRRSTFAGDTALSDDSFRWDFADRSVESPYRGLVVGWSEIDGRWPDRTATKGRHACRQSVTLVVGRLPQDGIPTPLRSAFNDLVEAWVTETALSSSLTTICSHWAYQRVIGMGPAVLPLIFEDVAKGQRHWGWALTAITGENPAAETDSPKGAAKAWLQWAEERGLVASESANVH